MTVKLLIIQGRPEGKSLLFPEGEYVFGRGAECHVRPNSDWVSRQHCLLRVTEDGVFLRDLGSRNGTLVNGVRLLAEARLGHGDQLQVGPLVFEVLLEDVAAGAPPCPEAAAETRVRSLDTEEVRALREASLGDGPPALSPPALPVRERGR
jgi:pSer/pThr/pTyr-binding forkhead associated (FHA) protein